MVDQTISVDATRLLQEIERLANYSDSALPNVTRIVFTESDRKARSYLASLYAEAGLAVRVDAVGNVFARWIGSEPDLPVVGTGSHCDAIPNSGKYDGTVGVLGGLEAIRSLQRAGFKPRRSIELIMFTAEEPTRYGIGCLGSRLLSGKLNPNLAESFVDNHGTTLAQTRREFGCQGSLDSVKLSNGYFSSFVELHIEQGPLLEQKQIPIGVVNAIAAPAALRCRIHGEGGHAGAVLMPGRRDALLGASELALAVERHVLESGGADTVGTTGYLKILPCAVNSIPLQADVEIDVRDIDLSRRDAVLTNIVSNARDIAERRNLKIDIEQINADPPAQCSDLILNAIRQSCADSRLEYMDMISRAYHDSLFMAVIAPVSMIFIPCFKGYSHRPDEFASAEAIRDGVEVLARTLSRLSSANDSL